MDECPGCKLFFSSMISQSNITGESGLLCLKCFHKAATKVYKSSETCPTCESPKPKHFNNCILNKLDEYKGNFIRARNVRSVDVMP